MSATKLRRTRAGNIVGNTDAVFDHWIERLKTPMSELRDIGRERDWQEKCSMSFRNDDLRHYGHWTLATAIRGANGRTRLVLVNGDRYPGSGGYGPGTTARTAHAERAARQAGFTVLNVPFSALSAAGVEYDSIRVLESLRESYTVTMRSELARDVFASLERDYSPYRRHEDGRVSVRDERKPHPLPAAVTQGYGHEDESRWFLERDGDVFHVPSFRHWLGEAIFSANVREGDRMRRAKFLSAFDHNEGLCYFLCELPRTKARTVDEGFAALMPAEVKRAQDAGLTVERQGDVFAIPTSMTTRELKARAIDQTITKYEPVATYSAVFGRRRNPDTGEIEIARFPEPFEQTVWDHVPYPVKSLRSEPLLRTNHVATEQITTVDGDTYARGMLHHRPERRDPDHRRVRLGDGRTWYRILKNTVPLARTVRPNTVMFTAQQSGQSRAWTLGGDVD